MKPKLTSLGTILHQSLRDLTYPDFIRSDDWTIEYTSDGKFHHISYNSNGERFIDGKRVK
jgi:hypothetical protein